MNIWAISAGITSILGIVGVIVYAIYKSQENVINMESISIDILRELKKVDITPELLSQLPKNERKQYLENQTKIPQSIIDSILVPNADKKIKYSLRFLIVMFVLAITSLLVWFINPNLQAENKIVPLKEKIKIAILKTDNIAYVESIYNGFVSTLESEFVYKPDIFQKYGNKHGDSIDYDEAIKTISTYTEFDYYVSIGTQASKALCEYFKKNSNNKPIIFLGVTDPIASNLISTLEPFRPEKNIAGVSYLGGIEILPVKIFNSFPNSHIYYMYSKKFPQDVIIANQLKEHKLYSDGKLDIIELNEIPTLSDFADSTGIYFSWYTFEKLLETPEGIAIADKRNIVATTLENVKVDGRAIAAYIADDFSIGRLGAELIYNSIRNKEELGKSEIKIPNQYFCINCNTLRKRGLVISKELLDNSDDNYRFSCNE